MSSDQHSPDERAASEQRRNSSDSGPSAPVLTRWGSAILTLAGLGVLSAPRAIGFSQNPGAITSLGRRLYAGGLAALCVALLLVTIAAIPLRRGEKWAFWAYTAVAGLFGLPMILMDTLYAPRPALVATLAPQVAGLAVISLGLAMCAQEIFRKD